MKRFKNKKAQQLVEFLLVAPFLVIILGIVTEYAYALNVNMTLSLGIKTVSADIYKNIKPNFTSEQIQLSVYNALNQYLLNNKIPVPESSLRLKTLTIDENVIFLASLSYYPAFTLPNTYFRILPEQFEFSASAVVPKAFLNDTSAYNLTTDNLLGMSWGKSGAMNNGGGWSSLFLVQTDAYKESPLIGTGGAYLLKSWYDQEMQGNNGPLVLKKGTGELYDCSSTTECTLYWNNLAGYVLGNYNTVFFVHDSSSTWLNPQGVYDISPESVTGVLKNAVALTNGSDMSLGNYDNIEVMAYNNIFTLRTYSTIALGTTVDKTTVVAYDAVADSASVDKLINP